VATLRRAAALAMAEGGDPSVGAGGDASGAGHTLRLLLGVRPLAEYETLSAAGVCQGATIDVIRCTGDALVLTASNDWTARLWSASTGECLRVLGGHGGPVPTARFSPNGTCIATCSHDCTAKVWDVGSGACLQTLVGHRGPVKNLGWSHTGVCIGTSSSDRTQRVWRPATGKCEMKWTDQDVVVAGATAPDRRTFVTCASRGLVALVRCSITRDTRLELHGHRQRINSVAFAPDGRAIATASGDGTAKLWDAETGQCVATLTGHDGCVNSACFFPDGRALLTAANDCTAKLWDLETGQCTQTFSGHVHHVYDAAPSPDGAHVATASRDGTAKVWKAATGECMMTLRGHEGSVNSVQFSP